METHILVKALDGWINLSHCEETAHSLLTLVGFIDLFADCYDSSPKA